MKTVKTLRGCAVLALLCLLPRASALTVTQTATFAINGGTIGYGYVPLTATWVFTPFDSNLGNLQSATFAGVASIVATVTEINPYSFPIGNGSFIVFNSHLSLGGYFERLVSKTVDTGGTLMEPNGQETTTTTVTNTFSCLYADPSLLAFFKTPSVPLIQDNQYGGWTSYGHSSAAGTAALALTYSYVLPDSGWTIGMLGTALIAVWMMHHLRLTRWPRW